MASPAAGVAKDEKVLLDLLDLPAVPHRLWTPMGFSDAAAAALRNVLSARKQAAEEADRELRRAKPKPHSEAQDRRDLGIDPDTDGQLMALADRLGISMEEVPPIVAAATCWHTLGPLGADRRAAAAARPADGAAHRRGGAQRRAGGRGGSAATAAASAQAQARAERQGRGRGRRAGRAAAGAARGARRRGEPTAPRYPPPPNCVPIVCQDCGQPVWFQFRSCGCPDRVWEADADGGLNASSRVA